MLWEPASTRQLRTIVPSPWISAPTELSSKTTPPFINSNVMGSSSSDDLREMMKTLASNTVTLQQNIMSFQQETRLSIHNLEKQMRQVALSVGKLEAQINGKLPSQTLNPIENVSVKELEEKRSK
jgi:hypothetical protein